MPMNCLIIVIDCLRADRVFNPEPPTPTINKLMENGTVFKQAFSATSTTSPSFASILTGLYPKNHGIRSLSGYKLKDDVKTLPEVFKENGYTTYAEVSGPLLPVLGLDRGFDSYNLRKHEDGLNSEWYENLLNGFKKMKEPWFMLLHIFDLHGAERAAIPDRDLEVNGNRYDRVVSYIDSNLKRLIDLIDMKNTLVVFLSDHGEFIVDTKSKSVVYLYSRIKRKARKKMGLETSKTNPFIGHGFHIYDYLVRIPLVFHNERIFPKGKSVSSQVSQVDIFPTIVDVLNLKANARTDGESVIKVMKGGERNVYMEACGAVLKDKKFWRSGIRTGKYKYMFAPYNDKIKEELYDLEKDPVEKRNIAKSKPDIAKELRRVCCRYADCNE